MFFVFTGSVNNLIGVIQGLGVVCQLFLVLDDSSHGRLQLVDGPEDALNADVIFEDVQSLVKQYF